MVKLSEKTERERRAARLKAARMKAGYRGPKDLEDRAGINPNNYKAHESGRNGFGISDARLYAKTFNVSLQWLNFNVGSINDVYVETTDLQREAIDLLQQLPPSVQQSMVESLRSLVAALDAQQTAPIPPAEAVAADP